MAQTWNFFGGNKYQKSEAHEIIEQYFSLLLNYFKNELKVDVNNFYSFDELVDYMLTNEDEYTYFWRFMKNSGLKLIHNLTLRENLNNSDGFLDLLDYRLYLLEVDIESGIHNNVFNSIADSLKNITEYSDSSDEIAITSIAEEEHNRNYSRHIVVKDESKIENDFTWSVPSFSKENENWNNLNPAEIQQDFCYYMGRE